MNKTTVNLITVFLVAAIVFVAGCAAEEKTTPEETPVSTPTPEEKEPMPTGHEQGGEPDISYMGLADVFKGTSGIDVSLSDVEIDEDDVTLLAFMVQPEAEGTYPGIIMIHEWWGLNDHVKSMADVMAREGYVVLTVDLFDGNVATTVEEAQANIRDNPNEETIPRMQAALKYLRNQANVDPGKIASLGWCYGGGQSFQLGINEDLQGVVIYYGQISTDEAVLVELDEPVLGIFGADDTSISVGDVREFERILTEQGTSADIYDYEGAGHAFANPTNTQAFREKQAIDAWNKTLDFMRLNLKEE
ncbi:MAG: dienelactone hydrolase family protein [Methanosarcinaceae archaeon]|nr:dienelactone hydrolase family protein [Methanosarcinaceae archaeon]